MSARPRYTPFHPKWYRPRVSVWWWLKSRPYVFFVLRELTSVFVALVSLLLLGLVRSLSQGPEAYARFLSRLQGPGALLLSGVTFAFVLLHTITWFHLAPKAMAVRLGGKRVPDWAIAGANYAAWVIATAVLWALVSRR